MSRTGNKPLEVRLSCRIERKDPSLPRFMVVPSELLDPWQLEGTTVVEVTLQGAAIGRRSLKKWDGSRWFVELTQLLCEQAGVDTGDQVEVLLQPASNELPEELETLIAENQNARAAWAEKTPSQQRMLREHVLAAKASATRRRRAERGLGVFQGE